MSMLQNQWEAKLGRFIQSAMAEGDLYAPSILLATKAAIGSIVWLIVWYDPTRSQTSEKCERIAAGVADFVIAGLHQRELAGQAWPFKITCLMIVRVTLVGAGYLRSHLSDKIFKIGRAT